MNKALDVAKTGLQAEQLKLDTIANNLANVGTTGFKRSRVAFEDLMYQTLRQPGAMSSEETRLPSGLQVGSGVKPVSTERIHAQGNSTQTDKDTNIMIQGEGFIQVTMPDGTLAYTRDGNLQKSAEGQLVTNNGDPIEPAIMLPADTIKLTIAADGTVSVMQAGEQNAIQIGQIQLATFMNPAGLDSRGDNLYTETEASGAPNVSAPGENGAGRLMQGWLETSNVQAVEEMIEMIKVQRSYEINTKVVDRADQMQQRLNNL
jgi:flagellar basal-body rod protein FlgG